MTKSQMIEAIEACQTRSGQGWNLLGEEGSIQAVLQKARNNDQLDLFKGVVQEVSTHHGDNLYQLVSHYLLQQIQRQ